MCGGENHVSSFSSMFYFLPLVCMHFISACAHLLFVTCGQGVSIVFLGRSIAFPTIPCAQQTPRNRIRQKSNRKHPSFRTSFFLSFFLLLASDIIHPPYNQQRGVIDDFSGLVSDLATSFIITRLCSSACDFGLGDVRSDMASYHQGFDPQLDPLFHSIICK